MPTLNVSPVDILQLASAVHGMRLKARVHLYASKLRHQSFRHAWTTHNINCISCIWYTSRRTCTHVSGTSHICWVVESLPPQHSGRCMCSMCSCIDRGARKGSSSSARSRSSAHMSARSLVAAFTSCGRCSNLPALPDFHQSNFVSTSILPHQAISGPYPSYACRRLVPGPGIDSSRLLPFGVSRMTCATRPDLAYFSLRWQHAVCWYLAVTD